MHRRRLGQATFILVPTNYELHRLSVLGFSVREAWQSTR